MSRRVRLPRLRRSSGGVRLAAQRRELRPDLALQQVGAFEIAPHLAQLELGALAAALERAQAGGLLDLAPPVFRLAGEETLDLALADDRVQLLAEADLGHELDDVGEPAADWLMRYCDDPSRVTRRMTLTSGVGSGSAPSALSKVSSTSALPLARRPSLPAKITSCMEEPRTVDGLCSPSAHTTASARLLLPLPLGPMMTPRRARRGARSAWRTT
jgi:hypothetical protein